MMRRASGALLCAAFLAGCGRPGPTAFSTDRARAHVQMLAETIGSRPVGSEANDRARQYLVDELRRLGFQVRVQSADARRAELGLTVRVHNLIAIKEATRPDAIALVSHYDSSPHAPGAADNAFGVAVSLESARALLREPMQHALVVLVTDGEEAGLMGAAAFNNDPLARRLGAYVNIEAVGSGGPSLLFETGPANGWIVDAWARNAPQPRGGSFAVEIYRRIPNDTDFSVLKRLNVPGLNFAAILDGHAYHTARDTAARLSTATIEQTGHNIVRTVQALDAGDLSRRTLDQPTYFDLLGRAAFSIGPLTTAWVTGLALLVGLVAWLKSLRAAVAAVGAARLVLTAVWSVVGSVAVVIGMIAAAWLLRESREVYHPWYASPDRLFASTALLGVLSAWMVARAGRLLPHGARGTRHPVLAWAIALPVWLLLAAAAAYYTPTAAYLFTLPLLASGLLLLVAPLSRTFAVRAASLVALAFNLSLSGWLLLQLLRFAVAHFGRMPIITPVWVYGVLMFAGASTIVPPALAVITGRPLRRPAWTTAVLLVLVVASSMFAYSAPAYTRDQPLRRAVMYAQDSAGSGGYWQVGSVEPGLDIGFEPGPWTPLNGPLPLAVPVARFPHPFVFHARARDTASIPGRVTLRTTRVENATEFTLSFTPGERAITAMFVMPPGVQPSRPNLPGIVRGDRWVAVFGAVPPEGAAFHAFVDAAEEPRLADARVLLRTHRLPGGRGWQGLPAWLPQDHTVWSSEARYIVQPLPEVAPPR